MLSFYGYASTKEKYLERLKMHRAADEIIKGRYWEEGKGCAVGCLVHTDENPHEKCEKIFNISETIWRLKDSIFEGLPNKIAKDFPINFFESIPVGVDTSLVIYKFLHWLLVDKKDGVINFAKTDESRKAINDVGNLFLRKINREEIEKQNWLDALDAAYAYANDMYAAAADAAAVQAAACAAGAGANAYAAGAGANAAACAYAAYAVDTARFGAGDSTRIKQSEKLIDLMKELGDENA